MTTAPYLGRRSILLTFFSLLSGRCAPRRTPSVFRELYVSPNGADTNPGTRDRPCRTLTRIRDIVRTVNRRMTGDIVVYLRGGTYPITRPIELWPADSGYNGFNVIYRAVNGEVPVISGGVAVTGWRLDHGRIYKAMLNRDAKLRSLFVNGVRANMSQTDAQGQGPWGEFTIEGTEAWADTPGRTLDGIQFSSADVPVFANPSDVELVQRRTWNHLVLGVRDVATADRQAVVKLQQPYGAIAATLAWDCNINPKGVFTLRNAYELLKRPGDFYFNRTTHTLYYFSNGEDMSRATVIAPLSQGLLRIAGTSSKDRVENLVFTGLTFAHDDWLLKRVGDSHAMAGVQSLALYTRFRADGNWHIDQYDICDLPQAAVELRNCRNIRVERNRFVHLGSGTGISLVNDVVDSAVVGNVFNDLAGNAINVGHPQHYVIGGGPLFQGTAGVCARNTVANNWIRHVSLDFKQSEAISAFFTQALEIAHNDIQGVPYGGIALGWWWGNAGIPPSKVPKDNRIAYNRVLDTHRELHKDGGAIYVLGQQPDGRIEGNYVRSAARLLYPDDGSAFWTITGNVLEPQSGPWLFIWTDRIHDLTVDSNYTTVAEVRNDGHNIQPTRTHVVDKPWPAEAQAIIKAAGLEPAYKNIAEDTLAR